MITGLILILLVVFFVLLACLDDYNKLSVKYSKLIEEQFATACELAEIEEKETLERFRAIQAEQRFQDFIHDLQRSCDAIDVGTPEDSEALGQTS